MPIEGTYEPSPWAQVADQIELYESSGGTEGTTLQGAPCVILWTRGRSSGAIRKSPLIRVSDGARYAVVASKGGAPEHPLWYLNLVADPNVSLQDGPVLQDYVAHTASPDERAHWWPLATTAWPSYDEYQTKTDREIPIVVLEPKT